MNSYAKWLAAIALSLLAAQAMATVELSGVRLEDSIELQGSKLQLNGAGIRYKAIFMVYVAGLYLGKKASTLEEVLATTGPKRMSVTMLRDIDSAELGKLFSRGIEDNLDKTAFARVVPGVLRMSLVFFEHKRLMKGDVFTLDWVPGTGTVLTIAGKPGAEPFKEPEFYDALMRIWLGPVPADWKLKESLLGFN
jgi:hypothetical protein